MSFQRTDVITTQEEVDRLLEAITPDIRRQEEFLLWGTVDGKPYVPGPPEPKRRWAIITIDGKRKLTFMDPDTMNAYVTIDYQCTEEKIPSFTFVRWARGHDL